MDDTGIKVIQEIADGRGRVALVCLDDIVPEYGGQRDTRYRTKPISSSGYCPLSVFTTASCRKKTDTPIRTKTMPRGGA